MKEYKIQKPILNIAFDETVKHDFLLSYFTEQTIKHLFMTGHLIDLSEKEGVRVKKGIKYWLNKLPHKLDFEDCTAFLNIYKTGVGYRIQYYGTLTGDATLSFDKNFKKALKKAYKALKKEGYLND